MTPLTLHYKNAPSTSSPPPALLQEGAGSSHLTLRLPAGTVYSQGVFFGEAAGAPQADPRLFKEQRSPGDPGRAAPSSRGRAAAGQW